MTQTGRPLAYRGLLGGLIAEVGRDALDGPALLSLYGAMRDNADMTSAEAAAVIRGVHEERAARRAHLDEQARIITTATGQVVYYLRFSDRVKIGTTGDLARRLLVIPHDEVLAAEPGSYDLERQRHQQFRHLWVMREWFQYEGELVAHIQALRQ